MFPVSLQIHVSKSPTPCQTLASQEAAKPEVVCETVYIGNGNQKFVT